MELLFLWHIIAIWTVLTSWSEAKHDKKSTEHKESSEEISGSAERDRAGLRCYKCDPTDNNNYCRDFKPKLATLYDCSRGPDLPQKASKTPAPLVAVINPDIPFSCYKIKGDVAYGHGKVFGAKRYGCGHVIKVRAVDVDVGEATACTEVRTPAKGRDFFQGVVCNCDDADGCNSAVMVSFMSIKSFLVYLFCICLAFSVYDVSMHIYGTLNVP